MPTMIYEPGVRIYVETEHHGLIDVSEDVTQGSMTRRSDGVSTCDFSIQNTRRKYDGVFTPNDRVLVYMKRLTWLLVYTGYLNSVPLITAWPREVQLRSSCSLKRLQYWFWDAYAQASQTLINNALNVAVKNRETNDGGITRVVITLLQTMLGWDDKKIHIGKIPQSWFDIARPIAQAVAAGAQTADALAIEFFQTVGGAGVIAGQANGAGSSSGVLKPVTYAGVPVDDEQCRNAEVIFDTGLSAGMSVRDCKIAIMVAMTESSLRVVDHGDKAGPDSRGLFQQRASWGSLSDRMDPAKSAGMFFRALAKVSTRDQMQPWQAAQAVQRSAYADGRNYRKFADFADAVISSLVNAPSLTRDQTFQANAPRLTAPAQGTTTGEAFRNVALKLVQDHPNIPYGYPRGDRYLSSTSPSPLACDSFVRWTYANTLGADYGFPPLAHAQAIWCQKNGQQITVEQGMKTPGALMFKGTPVNSIGHVEISLGDGKNTVGAHGDNQPASVAPASARYWDWAFLPPRLSFPNIGQGASAVSATDPNTSGASTDVTTLSQLPGYDPNDPFDQLFGSLPWYPVPATDGNFLEANSLYGIRALLNDQPLGPYVKNLFNATLRSFCSAPNGDLIAWFPDYYGTWGTAAVMVVEPIEVKDFYVEWSDDFFVTHQFTTAGVSNDSLNLATGTVQGSDVPLHTTFTLGIATIDLPGIMSTLFGFPDTPQEQKNLADWVRKRFGARPDFTPMEGLVGTKAEFFAAIFLFMRQWAYQYNADVPMTFMPELFPGMLLQIPEFDFQAYVTTVTHTWQFGEGGGFSTTANIAAPARMPDGKTSAHVLIGLPTAARYKPGRGYGNVEPPAHPSATSPSNNAAKIRKEANSP